MKRKRTKKYKKRRRRRNKLQRAIWLTDLHMLSNTGLIRPSLVVGRFG